MRPAPSRPLLCGVAMSFLATQAFTEGPAAPPVPVAYDRIAAEMTGRIDFETGNTVSEPGHLVTGTYHVDGAIIGKRFAGQLLEEVRTPLEQRFDAVSGMPDAPLALPPNSDGEIMALAHHRGLGSMAAFPLGPAGYPDIAARGEGALAVLFNAPQRATGLRLHADYPDPLGTRPGPGLVKISFYAADSALIGQIRHWPDPGVNTLAWRFGEAPLAGFVLTTTDPGGIAIDDILFAPARPTG